MSSTYTVGKLAAAFRTARGHIIYILFEQTYESNVSPRTPRWSCIYFGEIEGALQKIFRHASAAEGGMLRNQKGRLTPESYIGSWLQQLAQPVGYVDHPIRLEVGTNFYSAIYGEILEDCERLLSERGRTELLQDLAAGALQLRLHSDADLLAELVASAGLAPWRAITGTCCALSVPNKSLGYNPTASRCVEVKTPAFYRVDAENVLLQRVNGTWYCGGWQYSVVANYVSDLWEAELAAPDCYRKRIRAYRAAAKNAARLPVGAKLRIDLTAPLQKWQRESIADVCKRASGITRDDFIELNIDPNNADLLWHACRLQQDYASWIVPSAQAQAALASREQTLLDLIA